MVRSANAIDFWRGYALVAIFINHIPGIWYERLTHRNFSLSDSAELFVFLAGWALRYVVSGRDEGSTRALVFRLGGRALTIYAAQILISLLAIAILAAGSLWLRNPLLLEWHNAASVFYDPIETHIGLVLLTHQLGYFNILPLYVVLMVFAPVFAVIDRYWPSWVLPISLALYVVTLAFQISVPSWPVDGEWFFNPLAWQLAFVLGFVLARDDAGIGAFVRQHITAIRIVALPVVALFAVMVVFDIWPDPTKMPEPKLFFIGLKSYLTPMRIIQFLALVAVVSIVYKPIAKLAPGLASWLSLLGRNSLDVFCVASLLSLLGQIGRLVFRGSFAADTAMVLIGIALMTATAWMSEWRQRTKMRAAAAAA